MYGGIVDIEKTDTKTLYKLMINASELELKELSGKLEKYFIEYKASWLRTHFSLIYHSIFDSNDFESLKIFYNDIISKHPILIFESEDFTSLQETALVSILKRDDLNVEEIKIWDYVIKWGIAQNPTLPTNSEQWSKENFEALKTTLQQCLPLIRYFHIPGEDIWKNIKLYKKILEEQLWDDLTQYFMFPNQPVKSLVLPARSISTPYLSSNFISTSALNTKLLMHIRNQQKSVVQVQEKVEPSTEVSGSVENPIVKYNDRDFPPLPSRTRPTPNPLPSRTRPTPNWASGIFLFSTIINKEHVAELSSWIDRKSTTYSLANIPYEFQLIIRGSRDGFNQKTFWNMCHGHSGTIVVAKVAGTDEIVGGYNPLTWNNSIRGARIETKDSFIFSLKNNNNIKNSILSRVVNSCKALYYPADQNIYGPAFGNCEFMLKSNVSDLTQDKLFWRAYNPYNTYYEKSIRTRTTNEAVSILDYEVFKIIEKQIPNCTIWK
ncbi:hypothetical protein Glove_606g48 [Diversispora epigaea]|uniref:TLDc domain-containing protein n=1 Tax=Diversispora epigaea TaxID=1348612 RepID=A0A397GFH6_9GLOM|nr:hypothetical protein Glove_606g48 [Diversispora epigaea]